MNQAFPTKKVWPCSMNQQCLGWWGNGGIPGLNAGSGLGMAGDPIDPSLNAYGASQRYSVDCDHASPSVPIRPGTGRTEPSTSA
ncbi:hypothetical protein BDW72DRAFT_183881 [Aspergillus terricola var. indicus]